MHGPMNFKDIERLGWIKIEINFTPIYIRKARNWICIRTSRRVKFQLEFLAAVLCRAKTQTAAVFIWWTHRSSVSTTPKPNYGRQDIINEILHLACVNCRIHFSPPALRNLGCMQCITLLSTPFEWISSYPKLGSTHFSIHLYTSQKVIQRRDVQHCVGGVFT